MFSRVTKVTKQLIVASKCQFKLGSSLRSPLERKYCVFGRGFTSINGLFMEDCKQSESGAALVAVCQMNSTSDVDRNLGICKDLVKKAKSRGAKVKFIQYLPLHPWGMLGNDMLI